MKRRTVILAGLGAACAWVAGSMVGAKAQDTIAMIVRKRLDYLKLDPDGVERFARDMAALHAISNTRMHVIGGLRPLYTRFALSSGSNSLAYMLRHGEDRIVSTYLISSDFFVTGADETRVVNYHHMLDPAQACSNPFARRPV